MDRATAETDVKVRIRLGQTEGHLVRAIEEALDRIERGGVGRGHLAQSRSPRQEREKIGTGSVHFFPAGTRRFDSSNRFSTTLICVGAAASGSLGLSIRSESAGRTASRVLGPTRGVATRCVGLSPRLDFGRVMSNPVSIERMGYPVSSSSVGEIQARLGLYSQAAPVGERGLQRRQCKGRRCGKDGTTVICCSEGAR
jgi:hypothetical protein